MSSAHLALRSGSVGSPSNKSTMQERDSHTELLQLPPEILLQIISYLPTAQALRNSSLTCKILHEVVEKDGWKNLVQVRFPSFHMVPEWKAAAHVLTTLSRNWDRKAFIAHHFEPSNTRILHLPLGGTETLTGRWRRPQGQTMGFQPVVDSYDSGMGGNYTIKRDVVAYGAGARLMIHDGDTWINYQDLIQHQEGRDDITTVNLLQPHQSPRNQSPLQVVIGRASGDFKVVGINPVSRSCTERRFATRSALVRSADISTGQTPLLAACLGDSRAVLYSTAGDDRWVEPLSEIKCIDKLQPACRTWSVRFLSDQRLAIGRGPSAQIVHVYDIRPDGLDQEPTRTFGAGKAAGQAQTSAYPVCSLPDSREASASTGNVFLSGGYDGCIRIHDVRSPSDSEATIWDPTDLAPIFSLLMVGRERIVAGGAVNALLKIYDLRMAGGRAYSYLDLDLGPPKTPENNNDASYRWTGWNVFATSHDNNKKASRRAEGGPIYSLSRPSASSTSMYVGREASVLHFNTTAMLDRNPDPHFNTSVVRRHNGELDVQRTWDPDPQNRALKLSTYEQTKSGNMPLRIQGPIGSLQQGRRAIPGYDERWLEVGKGS